MHGSCQHFWCRSTRARVSLSFLPFPQGVTYRGQSMICHEKKKKHSENYFEGPIHTSPQHCHFDLEMCASLEGSMRAFFFSFGFLWKHNFLQRSERTTARKQKVFVVNYYFFLWKKNPTYPSPASLVNVQFLDFDRVSSFLLFPICIHATSERVQDEKPRRDQNQDICGVAAKRTHFPVSVQRMYPGPTELPWKVLFLKDQQTVCLTLFFHKPQLSRQRGPMMG